MSSHDGKTAVSASADGTVQMWDTGTGTLLKTLDGHTSSVLSVHMSHDAKVVVAGAADGSIKIWNESSAALATPQRPRGPRQRCLPESEDRPNGLGRC